MPIHSFCKYKICAITKAVVSGDCKTQTHTQITKFNKRAHKFSRRSKLPLFVRSPAAVEQRSRTIPNHSYHICNVELLLKVVCKNSPLQVSSMMLCRWDLRRQKQLAMIASYLLGWHGCVRTAMAKLHDGTSVKWVHIASSLFSMKLNASSALDYTNYRSNFMRNFFLTLGLGLRSVLVAFWVWN